MSNGHKGRVAKAWQLEGGRALTETPEEVAERLVVALGWNYERALYMVNAVMRAEVDTRQPLELRAPCPLARLR